MLIGYVRVSKSDGSQVVDLQKDALLYGSGSPGPLYVALTLRVTPPFNQWAVIMI